MEYPSFVCVCLYVCVVRVCVFVSVCLCVLQYYTVSITFRLLVCDVCVGLKALSFWSIHGLCVCVCLCVCLYVCVSV